MIGDYQIIDTISRGSYSNVFKVKKEDVKIRIFYTKSR